MIIMMAKVRDTILEKTTTELVIYKNNKKYFGKLFFEPICERVVRKLDVIELDDNIDAKTIIDTAYSLVEKYGQLAKDGKTYSAMKHWAYMNGLVNEYLD